MASGYLCLCSWNVGNRSLDGDHTLGVEGGDVADGADRDLAVRVLHDFLDRCSALPYDPPYQVVVGKNLKEKTWKQDKVNTADSAFIFLIILLISQNKWSGWSGQRRWSCLVWSLRERYRVWWVLWWLKWHLCLYIWEKWEMSRLWHTHTQTDGKWKVVHYSVWAESAIQGKMCIALKHRRTKNKR